MSFVLAAVLTLASAAWAQESPPSSDTKPFNGVIKLDVRDSVQDWGPYLPKKAPEGASNVLFNL